MSTARGRGFALSSTNHSNSSQQSELRRPGQLATQQKLSSEPEPQNDTQNVEALCFKLCDKMGKMNLSNAQKTLEACAEEVATLCDSVENLEVFADNLFNFALKSKWNSHVAAEFCDSHGDISASSIKLRTLMLRKLQNVYKERNKFYLDLDTFLLHATFACEIFHHVRIDGACIKVLSQPIIDFLAMLVDGSSQKEIETFLEQFPKCCKNLQENAADGFETLMVKIRKQIVCESITATVRAMLLEIFESVLTDWKPINQSGKFLYGSLSKPIIRICD